MDYTTLHYLESFKRVQRNSRCISAAFVFLRFECRKLFVVKVGCVSSGLQALTLVDVKSTIQVASSNVLILCLFEYV